MPFHQRFMPDYQSFKFESHTNMLDSRGQPKHTTNMASYMDSVRKSEVSGNSREEDQMIDNESMDGSMESDKSPGEGTALGEQLFLARNANFALDFKKMMTLESTANKACVMCKARRFGGSQTSTKCAKMIEAVINNFYDEIKEANDSIINNYNHLLEDQQQQLNMVVHDMRNPSESIQQGLELC